jgi:predicted amidohydrolase
MKIGYYQFDVKFGDKEYNLAKLEKALQGITVDLLVLPELFTTGILFSDQEEVAAQAEPIPNGYTCNQLVRISMNNNCHIIGSILEAEDGQYYNTAVLVGPNGYIGKRRKIHLPDDEKRLFSQGENLEIFDINGVQVGVIICFECWLPEASRTLAAKGAQIIVHTANIMSESTLDVVKVRAMENGIYWVCANRIGSESNDEMTYRFRGESRIIDRQGNLLKTSGRTEDAQVVEIFPERDRTLQLPNCRDLRAEIQFYKRFV